MQPQQSCDLLGLVQFGSETYAYNYSGKPSCTRRIALGLETPDGSSKTVVAKQQLEWTVAYASSIHTDSFQCRSESIPWTYTNPVAGIGVDGTIDSQ